MLPAIVMRSVGKTMGGSRLPLYVVTDRGAWWNQVNKELENDSDVEENDLKSTHSWSIANGGFLIIFKEDLEHFMHSY